VTVRKQELAGAALFFDVATNASLQKLETSTAEESDRLLTVN